MMLFIALLAAIGGSLVGYFIGAFCATMSDIHMDKRNTQLWWALRALVEAAELYHDEDPALGKAIGDAREALKGE